MFSKKVFNKQYGQIFIIFNLITFIGFLLFIYAVFLANGPIVDGGLLGILLGLVTILGFPGFPISLCFYFGEMKKYNCSNLSIENEKIYYMVRTYSGNTILGPTIEEKYYDVLKVEDYKITNRWLKIKGEIIQETIYNSKSTSKKQIDKIKIARAFTNDEEITKFLKKISKFKEEN